ncbi:MAG: DMT family transporter [Tidjanibacter sp.]|nr:DMT family transporter [Tidjanibacter sp.]
MATKTDTFYHILALAIVLVWGVTFVSTKVLISAGLTPEEIYLIRFVVSYLGIWLFSPRKIFADSWRDELRMALLGITGGTLYFLAENTAIEYSFASNVALIVCTAPLWTAIAMGIIDPRERLKKSQAVGSVAALAGVALVVLNGRFVLHLSPKGDLLALGAAISWMLYSIVLRRVNERYSPVFISRKTFFYGVLTVLPVVLVQPLRTDWSLLAEPAVWLNLLFLSVVASLLCFVGWNAVINRLGVVRTTNYVYFNPIVAVVASAIVLGERITPYAILGAAMIIAGMYFAERRTNQQATRRKEHR